MFTDGKRQTVRMKRGKTSPSAIALSSRPRLSSHHRLVKEERTTSSDFGTRLNAPVNVQLRDDEALGRK